MKIDYNKLDPKCVTTVRNIENKPHVRYIRYLLSKGYSPIVIKKELQKLGLSAPHERPLTVYYLSVLDPIIKAFNLSPLYAGYKSRLINKNNRGRGQFAKNLINFRVDLGDDPDGQVNFCKMVRELDIEDLWLGEIIRFFGSVRNMPVDESGNRIIRSSNLISANSVTRILCCDKRFLIDKMLLENLPAVRIVKYARENLKLKITEHDLALYRKLFFSVQTQSLEEKIQSLVTEKNSLQQTLKDYDDPDMEDGLSIADIVSLKENTERRIKELDDNIKGLNAMYTETAVTLSQMNEQSFQDMFTDIIGRAYARFTNLDRYKDRDVVDPLMKTAKMMGYAYDKVESIKTTLKTTGNGINQTSDIHSSAVILELYGKRIDEINEENTKRAGSELNDLNYGEVNIEDIDGINELGIAYEEEKE